MTAQPQHRFTPPPGWEAATPPQERGLTRDQVRMFVAHPDYHEHRRVSELPQVLHPGDLLVLNTSATLPAAVKLVGRRRGQTVHVSTQLDDGVWVVEVRAADNTGPGVTAAGDVLLLPGRLELHVGRAHPAGQSRLWRATPSPATRTPAYLAEYGRPIGYRYLTHPVPLAALQNVYAEEPGSAEMPSAGRPLSKEVLVRLMARGVVVAPIVLHTGVSSQEDHEPPQPERFTVPEATARLVRSTRGVGRRVVAVGTTVVRALETVADRSGRVHPATGWTDLVLGPDRPTRAVHGILTGLHEPEASHLSLLEAVAGPARVQRAYDTVTGGSVPYLWHEFGDTMLLLPD